MPPIEEAEQVPDQPRATPLVVDQVAPVVAEDPVPPEPPMRDDNAVTPEPGEEQDDDFATEPPGLHDDIVVTPGAGLDPGMQEPPIEETFPTPTPAPSIFQPVVTPEPVLDPGN